MPTKSRKTYRVIEPEVQNNKNVVSVTLDFVEKLGSVTPGTLNFVKSFSGGSESMEAAIKFARQYFKQSGRPGKYKFISRYYGYHGATMAVYACIGFNGAFAGPLAFGVVLDLTSPSGIGGETGMSWGWAFACTGLVVTLGPLALALLGRSPVSSTTRIDADRRE